jgi:hypothetical protein
MSSTIGWAAYAAANTAAGAVAAEGLSPALVAGLGPVAAATVTLVAGTKALLDLSAAYGPVPAVLAPALVQVTALLGHGHSSAPAAASVALAVLAQSARKVSRS